MSYLSSLMLKYEREIPNAHILSQFVRYYLEERDRCFRLQGIQGEITRQVIEANLNESVLARIAGNLELKLITLKNQIKTG